MTQVAEEHAEQEVPRLQLGSPTISVVIFNNGGNNRAQNKLYNLRFTEVVFLLCNPSIKFAGEKQVSTFSSILSMRGRIVTPFKNFGTHVDLPQHSLDNTDSMR